ncbi:MAG: Holliday junction branch migration protein RuvA [Erysipelotrichaceae bacterium]|jgi:Holliday junction DNA helicase RuvA
MIAFIKGKVHSFTLDWVILDCGNIGYKIYFAHPEKLKLNEDVLLYTYQYIREDEHSLFGFLSQTDYDLFTKLISVKGVGCKTANSIFASSNTDRLVQAIEVSDIDYLKKLPGIGAKTASQIILDLKGKLVSEHKEDSKLSKSLIDTFDALKSLGYKQSELNPLVKQLENHVDQSTDALLKLSLQILGQKRGK